MRAIAVAIIITAAIASAYAEVRNNGFVDYDDPMYVTKCTQVQKGLTLESVTWAFSNYDAANWHPLTWLSHMLDYELFADNAGMHHLMNVGLHVLNALLVLACFSMLTGAFWPSAMAAMIWALHPLRVESVAWISERKDLLSAMFGLLCILAHTWHARRPTLSRGFVAWLALALGLLCKPMLVTWPFLLLVLDVWPLRRWRGYQLELSAAQEADLTLHANPQFGMGALIVEKIPMMVICAASSMLTVLAQRAGGAVVDTTQVGLWPRVANAIVAYVRYIGDIIWPHDLAVLYPLPSHWPLLTVLGAAAVLAAITVAAIGLRRRMPWILTGWLWFLGTLVPVIGLVQVGAQSMADRYTYLPQLGLLLAGVMTINRIVRGRAVNLIIISLALSVPLWIGTRSQTLIWRDSVTLYEHALAVTRDNWLIHNNLGVMAMDREQLDVAETHYREALRLHPEHAVVHGNLAEIVARRGNTTEAIRHLNEAIRLDPDNLAARNNLAWLLATARSPVVRNANRAVEIAQQVCADVDHESLDYPVYLDTLAAAYASAGRFDEAVATARKALELADPVRQVALRVQIDQNLQRYLNRQPPM